MGKSLYETLDISEDASVDEIRRAYRKLARKYHPDINKDPDAEEKFKEINAAYEVLSDPDKKRQYDQFGDQMFGGQNFRDFARGQGAGVDIDEILRNIFSGGFGGFNTGGFSGFDMGGMGTPNLDIHAKIVIPFNTAVLGGTHSITAGGERFDVRIPAGVKTGETLRIRSKGKNYNGQKGDLLLKIEVAPSCEFERDEDNLYKKIDVPLKIAMFGGKVKVSTLEKEITLKIPKNTKNEQKFRVKGLGATNRKTKIKGDLYLVVNIVLPNIDELDLELVEVMEKKLPGGE